MIDTRNDLAANTRGVVVNLLQARLADAIDLGTQTKQAHWNVKGIHFHTLHLFFDSLAESVEEYVDLIAERATSLGGTACGTVRMSAAASRLTEYPIDAVDGKQHLEALSTQYAALAKSTRAAIDTATDFGDADTADLFTEVSRGLDTHLWMLESHLQG